MSDLARRAVTCPRWRWMPGMLTHSTNPGGFPCCPAGTPIRVETLRALEDCVVERMFGPITPEPSHHHPDFERLCALHDADMAAAWARVLPDLADAATIGCLLALVREAWGLPKACVIWNADKGRVHDPEMDWAQGDDNDPDVIALLNQYSWMVKGLGQTDEWLENIEGRVSPEIYQHVVRDILGHGASEAEALVNALEGAP